MARRAQKRFTDREESKKIFLEKLLSPQEKDEYRLLTFYGVGGQGKSALFEYFLDRKIDQNDLRFSEWAERKGELPDYKIASLSFQNTLYRQSHEALMEIRQGFLGEGIDFFNFNLAFTYYLQKAYPNKDMKEAYPKLYRTESGVLNDLADLLSLVPSLETGITLLKVIGNRVSKFRPQFRKWYEEVGRELARELEQMSSEELLGKLARYLGNDLKAAIQKNAQKRLVIMMDTYEALSGEKQSGVAVGTGLSDKWVRDLVSASPGVLFVFLGRDYLRWDKFSKSRKARNYEQMLKGNQHLLDKLSDEDADLFLRTSGMHGVYDDAIRKKIIASSGGLPFYLDIQLESYFEILADDEQPSVDDFGDSEPEILERFLKHLNENQRYALLILGQARKLNQNIFDLLKSNFFNGLPVDFSSFKKHSFINKTGQKKQYGMHQLMQEHLHTHVKDDDPDRFNNIHTKLFEHYDQIAIVEDIKNISQEQEVAFAEANYHKQRLSYEEYISWFYERQKRYYEAARYELLIPLHEELLELSKENIGDKHLNYASGINILAALYKNMGQYDEAEPLFRQAIEIDKNTIGDKHPDYATHLNNLAELLRNMGRYEEAEPLFRQAIEIDKNTIGDKHLNYATDLNNLALLLESMGRYEEAEPLFRQAIEINKNTIGDIHPKYASGLNNLAGLLKSMGRYEEAEPLYRQAIEINKETIGDKHPDFAGGLNNVALLLSRMGRYEEAEPLYRQAIEIGKETIGDKHPNYASGLNNLALLLSRMGRYEEAEPLYRQAIEIDKETIGVKHPDFASRLINLASLHKNMGRYEEAELLFRQAIEIDKETIGEKHPNYTADLKSLTFLLKSMGRYEEAEPLYRQAIEIDKETIGEKHPDYARDLNNLAGLLRSMGRYEEAEPLYRQAIEICLSSLGEEHPNTIAIKGNYEYLLKAIQEKE